ncbi:MAG: hypothetical protein Q9226_007726 [Calogaya cf. arnoldii]
MIYRELMLSNEDETEMKTGNPPYMKSQLQEVKEARKSRRNDGASLLLTNRQLQFEASKVLVEERYYRTDLAYTVIDGPRLTVADDEVPLYHSSPFELLSTIRNIQISLAEMFNHRPYGKLDIKYALGNDDIDAKHTHMFCNDLASHAGRL